MDYAKYKPYQLAANNSFQNWVLSPTLDLDTFWMEWLIKNLYKIEEVATARKLVIIATTDLGSNITDDAEDRIWDKITSKRQISGRTISLNRKHTAIAAAVALLLVFTFISYRYNKNSDEQYVTTKGEIRRIQLPDGTMTTLNANSKLTIQTDWKQLGRREVWLSGEAFFKVKKQITDGKAVKFTVHTKDVDLTVKGTEFNVNTRQDQTRVVLVEGKVDLSLIRNGQKNTIIYMKPGDGVNYSSKKEILDLRRLSDPDLAYAWKDGRWEFNNTPIAEVFYLIEDSYGLPLHLDKGVEILQTVTGSIPSDNLDDILASLESILNVKINRATGMMSPDKLK